MPHLQRHFLCRAGHVIEFRPAHKVAKADDDPAGDVAAQKE